MRNIKCLALDFGGTLAEPSNSPGPAEILKFISDNYAIVLSDEFYSALTQSQKEATINYKTFGTYTSWTTILQQAASNTGITLPDLHSFEKSLWGVFPDGKLYSGVKNLIHALNKAGYTIILASNTRRLPKSRRETLQAYEIISYFHAEVISSEIGVGKPHPLFYQSVLAAAASKGHTPEEILFIGDSLVKDVLEPQKHGMRAIKIGQAVRGVLCITNICDIGIILGVEPC